MSIPLPNLLDLPPMQDTTYIHRIVGIADWSFARLYHPDPATLEAYTALFMAAPEMLRLLRWVQGEADHWPEGVADCFQDISRDLFKTLEDLQ